MRTLAKNFILLLIVLFAFFKSFAQQNTISSGNQAVGTGGTVSYSIGQVFTEQIGNVTHNILPGVQQPYEISLITSNPVYENFILECSVFPNPTADLINVKVDAKNLDDWSYLLFELSGKVLVQGVITSNIVAIPIVNQPVGTYFLKISFKTNLVKIFKIIKTQ